VEITALRQETANNFDREDPLKFTGHERDFNVGTDSENINYDDYMHARFFVSNWGRFLSPDPVLGSLLRPQSWNRYTYVLNNPINLVDEYGLLGSETNADTKDQHGDPCPEGTLGDCWTVKPKPKLPGPIKLTEYERAKLEFAIFKANSQANLARLRAYATRKDMPLYHGRTPDYVGLTLGAA